MCLWDPDAPRGNIVQNGYFQNQRQGHKVINYGDILMGFVSRVRMSNMKTLSLMVQCYGQG